jgi:iron complex outermembrane receptor protein
LVGDTFRTMRTLVLATGLVACTSTLRAQQDTVTRRDTALLAPAVITVTRTTQPADRAPFAIGVTTRDEIQRAKAGLALDDALAAIPGVQVDNRFNYALGERISVRGIGARAQFGVRGVRVLLDGIPMTIADGQTTLNNVDVSQLARAEVIRGPASMLHGNAAGGVIQLESDRAADVTTQPLGGELRIVGGSHGLVRTNATLAGDRPASDFTAAVSRLRFEGFRQWSDARNDHANVRFSRGVAGGTATLVANVVDYDGRNPGGLSNALLAANRDTVSPSNLNNRTGETGTQGQIGGTWERLVRGTSVSVAAHGLRRTIDNPIPGTVVAIDRGAGGARLSLARTMAALRLGGGAEMQIQDDARQNFANATGERGALTLDQRERVRNSSVFAQGSFDAAAGVALLAGARWDHVAFRADDRFITPTNGDDSGDRTMTTVSPSVGITWSVAPRMHLFANVGTAFETPTTSELSNRESGAGGLNPDLEPQRALSSELGARGTVRGVGILGTWDVALFNARVRDALIPYQNTAGRTYYRNAAATTNRGVEVAAALVFPAGIGFRGAFTHTDARFDDYAVVSGTATTVYDGLRVPGVAANRFDGSLSAQRALFFVDVDARAYSSVPVTDANSDRAPAYMLFGTRAGLRDLRVGTLRATPTLAVQNMFDREYITAVTVNAFGGRYFEPGPGRTINAGLSINY